MSGPVGREVGIGLMAGLLVERPLEQRQQASDLFEIAFAGALDGDVCEVVAQHVLGVGTQHQGCGLAGGLMRQPGGVACQPGIQRRCFDTVGCGIRS